MSWNIIGKLQSYVLRSTYQQTPTGLLWQPPGITQRVVDKDGNPSSYVCQLGAQLRRWSLYNAAATGAVGIGFRIANQYWVAGQLSGDGLTFTDDTVNAQSGISNAFPIQVVGADQTGFVVACIKPFAWVSMNMTTAETDAGGATVPDHAVQYSNAAGTGWSSAAGMFTDGFTKTDTVWGTGAHEFVWMPPTDWGKVVSLATIPLGYYALRFTSHDREAADVAALSGGLEIGLMDVEPTQVTLTSWKVDWSTYGDEIADALVAYFATANNGNRVYAEATTK